MSEFRVWECQVCGWIYDEEKGDADEGFAPGTKWEDIPDDWLCPECGVGKEDFEMVEVKRAAAMPAAAPAVAVEESPAPMAAVSDNEAPIVIIGAGLAGYTLLKELRQQNVTQPIVVITRDNGHNYSKPMLSTGFAKQKSAADLAMASAEEMAEKYQAEILIHTDVLSIDKTAKTIALDSGATMSYDKLVFATGASCIRIPLAGDGLHKVHSVNDLEDYDKFRALVKNKRKVLIMGAGLIGCEYANDLHLAGYEVEVVDMLDGALRAMLPEKASKVLSDALEAKGIRFHFAKQVSSIDSNGNGVTVNMADGSSIEADLVLSAVGLKPNTQLAASAGINCNRGIAVNAALNTDVQGIYAIGDCAEVCGHTLFYVMPLVVQAKALAKTFAGETTAVTYGVMPVTVKTTLHPVSVYTPPANIAGQWLELTISEAGAALKFVDENGTTRGFALTEIA